jgi:hypothetical protein
MQIQLQIHSLFQNTQNHFKGAVDKLVTRLGLTVPSDSHFQQDAGENQSATTLTTVATIRAAAAKSKEKQRINTLKILHFDSRYEAIVNQAFHEILAFNDGFNFPYNLLTSF